MPILSLKIKIRAPGVHSLKEKRMVVKSLIAKLRNKFNVSAKLKRGYRILRSPIGSMDVRRIGGSETITIEAMEFYAL